MGGLEGRTLDRYELKQMIGKGGMADVYLGYDPRFERTVAVKVFKRDDENLLRRFIREARLMASLRHAHLMPIYDTGESTLDGVSQYFIVMPFMEGGTLRERIHRDVLSLQETCRYLRQIADVLDYVHQRGIIHRDIKSSNVLLDAEDRCYLSDFGIARTMHDATMTTTEGVLGTVDYVAPELFEENQKANAASDLYSLGVLVFEMVTRQLPFSAESQIALVAMHINRYPPSPRCLVPHLSLQTERIMLKALEKRPEQRYASAVIFAEMFCRSIANRSGTGVSAEIPPVKTADIALRDRKTVALPPPAVDVSPRVRPMPPARSTEGRSRPTAADSVSRPSVHQLQPVSIAGKRHSSRANTYGIVVAILALLALLVVVTPMVFISLNRQYDGSGTATPLSTQPVAQLHSTTSPTRMAIATPTPNQTANTRANTATAVRRAANATATAIAGPTATVEAQISATAGVIRTATAGNPIYSDPLNDSDGLATRRANWDRNANCTFRGDGYHVSAKKVLGNGQSSGCIENGHAYANATISADMTILSGHSGGVFFRASTALLMRTYAGYLFEVDKQGHYTISRSSNFVTGKKLLSMGTVTRGFHTGSNVRNTLQVIADGSSLSFYINGVFLDTEIDTSFTSGGIAFLATSYSGGSDAEIVYSNLQVFPIA